MRVFILLLIIIGAELSTCGLETVYLSAADRAENAVPQPFVACLKRFEQLLHIFPLGGVIFGAERFHDRQICVPHVIQNVLFLRIEQGADEVQIRVGKITISLAKANQYMLNFPTHVQW